MSFASDNRLEYTRECPPQVAPTHHVAHGGKPWDGKAHRIVGAPLVRYLGAIRSADAAPNRAQSPSEKGTIGTQLSEVRGLNAQQERALVDVRRSGRLCTNILFQRETKKDGDLRMRDGNPRGLR